ncbi:MAG: zinc-ribbon domain containing protein, partial [Pyrinomonadaceae bacterium]|nr:zinc-ribbon domain containing protein [Pyrinomonadaceae bacterium]
MSNYQEQTLTCADCGRDFSFSERDQEFYREKGFEPPKRCKDCRDAKKAQRGDA